MAITLSPPQFAHGVLSLIDPKTCAVIPAVFSNVQYSIDDPTIGSVDNNGKITALKSGNAKISVSATVTYTNNLGNTITENKICHFWKYSE